MNAVDTNILIYACDGRDPAKQARVLTLVTGGSETVLLWQVACEFIAASRKLAPQGLTPEHAWARLASFARLMPLVLPSQEAMERARELHLRAGVAFWDSLLLGAALEAGATELFSEDVPGGSVPGIKVINPFV